VTEHSKFNWTVNTEAFDAVLAGLNEIHGSSSDDERDDKKATKQKKKKKAKKEREAKQAEQVRVRTGFPNAIRCLAASCALLRRLRHY
jgi:hypothetical protein